MPTPIPHSAVAAVTLGRVRTGTEADAARALIDYVRAVRAAGKDGLLRADAHRGRTDAGEVLIYEVWSSAVARDHAEAAPAVAHARRRVEASLAGPPRRLRLAALGLVTGVRAVGVPDVTVLAFNRARPERIEDLRGAEATLLGPTRADAARVGLIDKHVHAGEDDLDLVVLYENWLSRAEWRAYNGEHKPDYLLAYYDQAKPGSPDGFTAEQSASEWTMISEPVDVGADGVPGRSAVSASAGVQP